MEIFVQEISVGSAENTKVINVVFIDNCYCTKVQKTNNNKQMINITPGHSICDEQG